MNPISVFLRRETPADAHAVETLTREAFWNLFVPGCYEHYLVHVLRESDALIPELNFVAELDGALVGHIMYAKSTLALDTGCHLPVITFGPVSVLPAFQKRGIGSTLIRHTLALARQMGFPAVFIYGDPAYYSRLGFQPAERYGIAAEDNEYRAALQAVALQPNALQNAQGRFLEGSVYQINQSNSEAFDRTFPPKVKHSGTPSQQLFLEILARHKPRGQQ